TRVTGRRVHDEARRFVDDDEMLVLVRDPQVHRLGREAGLLRLRWLELDLLSTRQAVALAARVAVDPHGLGLEEPLGHTPGADLRQRGEEAVEPLARSFLRDALLHARALRVRTASPRPVGARDDPAGP